jgi:hypothetical protein
VSMPALKAIHQSAVDLPLAVAELVRYGILFVFAFVSFRAKAAATIVALRSQLAHRVDRVREKKEPKPRFTPAFRVVWLLLSKVLDGWEEFAQLMKPATSTFASLPDHPHHTRDEAWREHRPGEASRCAPTNRGASPPRSHSPSSSLWRLGWNRSKDSQTTVKGLARGYGHVEVLRHHSHGP